MKAYERFLEYGAYPTMSDESSDSCPSTKKQLKLAEALCEELISLGLTDAQVDGHGYVYASLEKNTDSDVNSIGFIAHMDTSPEACDENIKFQVVDYEGGDILLNEEAGIYLKADDYPYLEDYKGQHLITSDGTTLIGADDKAGIAEIITALEKIIDTGVPHGKICVAFTPDEEIGRGADLFDVETFGADYAYTVDGGPIGELEYENFNAASARVKIHGVSIHPGSAKDRMKNAALIACEFNSLLPPDEIPAKTEGYEGFYHLTDMSGGIENADMHYIIRDHDREKFESKKFIFKSAIDKINEIYGDGTAEVEISDSYYNMKEKIEPHMYIVDRAKAAMEELGIRPVIVPIRGGTDGARLSFMGLPCPNLCTGGENFHSRFEFISVEAMEKISDILVKIIENAVKDGKR
ncbi:MAG: peptidase T [Ruminococcaceae bacterium]|nr:peptidase T [Oscillospiraceae bacterium]